MVERGPIPVWQLMNFVALQDGKQGLAVLSDGLRDFEVIGEQCDTLALTLLRGVGVLGKKDQPTGVYGDHISANVMQVARTYLSPGRYYNKIPFDAMRLNKASFSIPLHFSLLTMDPSGRVLSALKKAEYEEALVIRVHNSSEQPLLEGGKVSSEHILSNWRVGVVPLPQRALSGGSRLMQVYLQRVTGERVIPSSAAYPSGRPIPLDKGNKNPRQLAGIFIGTVLTPVSESDPLA